MTFKINAQCPYCGHVHIKYVEIAEVAGNHLFKFWCEDDDSPVKLCGKEFVVSVELQAVTESYRKDE